MRAALADRLARLFRATEEENRRAILAALPARAGATLLDLGCGDGALTVRAAARVGAARVLGVETAPAQAQAARERGVEVASVDLGGRLPYDDGAIDVVLSNQVIEHLCDTDVFVREIARVLAPDGVAVVSTNNLASWHNVASLVVGWQPLPCHVSDLVATGNPARFDDERAYDEYPMHRRIFTGRGLASLARLHGLEATLEATAGYYPLAPRAARLATRLDPRHGAFLVQRFVHARPA